MQLVSHGGRSTIPRPQSSAADYFSIRRRQRRRLGDHRQRGKEDHAAVRRCRARCQRQRPCPRRRRPLQPRARPGADDHGSGAGDVFDLWLLQAHSPAGRKLAVAVRLCARSCDSATEIAKEIQVIHSDQLLWSREERAFISVTSSCCAVRTRPVKPVHRPDRDSECQRDLVVAEVGQRVEEQRVPLTRPHRRKCSCQPGAEELSTFVRRLVLVGDRVVDSAATVGVQLAALGPPVAMEQVRRDPVEPWQDAPPCTTALPPREGKRERL